MSYVSTLILLFPSAPSPSRLDPPPNITRRTTPDAWGFRSVPRAGRVLARAAPSAHDERDSQSVRNVDGPSGRRHARARGRGREGTGGEPAYRSLPTPSAKSPAKRVDGDSWDWEVFHVERRRKVRSSGVEGTGGAVSQAGGGKVGTLGGGVIEPVQDWGA